MINNTKNKKNQYPIHGDKMKTIFNKAYKSGIVYTPIPVAFFDDYFPNLKGEALDFGCGRGESSLLLAKRGMTVDSIDQSTQAFKQRIKHGRINYYLGDETILHLLMDYDFILLKYVLAFIKHKKRFIRTLTMHLKKGGKLLIITPVKRKNYNKKNNFISVDRNILCKPIYKYYNGDLEIWYCLYERKK